MLGLVALATPLMAQKQEISFTLGGIAANERSTSPSLTSEASVGLQANYAVRLVKSDRATLYFETHLLASPLRNVSTTATVATRDYASLYITPGVRVKFMPQGRVNPWLAVGGGWALYEHSVFNLLGAPSSVPRHTNKGALQFGGGVDFRIWKFVALRAELRDFYTGSPAYAVTTVKGGQHNVVAGGGFVLRFGK